MQLKGSHSHGPAVTPTPKPPHPSLHARAQPPANLLIPTCSNQGGIKGALAGVASEKAWGRVDNMLKALNKKGEEVPVQVGAGDVAQVCVAW